MNKKRKRKISWKQILCITIFLLSILFGLFVYIKKPSNDEVNNIYDSNNKITKAELNLPLTQHIKIDKDRLKKIDIYLGDLSINDINYSIQLIGSDGKTYFDHNYEDYNADIIEFDLGIIEKSKNMEFDIKITCNDICDSFYANTVKQNDKNNSITNMNNTSLVITYDSNEYDKTYYWYAIMGILISLTLYPLAKEDNDEKKK